VLIETLCRLNIIPATVMIAPSEMAGRARAILASASSTATSLRAWQRRRCRGDLRLLGFVAGLVIHAWPALRGAVEPLLASYYATRPSCSIRSSSSCFGVDTGRPIALRVLLAVVANDHRHD